MARKSGKEAETGSSAEKLGQAPAAHHTSAHSFLPAWINNFGVQAGIVALIAFLFYCNTFNNEYALDDTVVIVKNEFVHEGIAGIPDILTKDAYYSYYDQLHSSDQLSGGRYRPLSIVTFAIEQQFFGATRRGQTDSIIAYGLGYGMKAPYERKFIYEMHVRHVLNVVWYILAVVALLYFLRSVVFRTEPLMAFIAALLFTIHPLHTEVVANVKSRDEIMSLLFISLTFIFAFRYKTSASQDRNRNKMWLLWALLSYFLAFLSKEYAITLLALLPLSFYLFQNESISRSLKSTIPYAIVALVYIFIRWRVIGPRNELSDNDIQINPYAWVSASQKLATEIATSLNYLKLLIYPHPLSSDYSYNQIPYKDLSHPLVWLSLLVHLGLGITLIYLLRKRHVLAFAIAFYLFNLLMVNNLLFDIGATMGERLIFHASVGFVIAVAWLLVRGAGRVPQPKVQIAVLGVVMVVVVTLCGFKTIERNKDWKNDETLFLKDIEVSPNSFLVNENVGAMLINRSDFEKDERKKTADLRRGVALFTRVIGMQENYVLGYMNRSAAYFKLGETDSMMADLDKVNKLYPMYPSLPNMYYHAGDLYMSQKQYAKAVTAFSAVLRLTPNDKETQTRLEQAKSAADSAAHR